MNSSINRIKVICTEAIASRLRTLTASSGAQRYSFKELHSGPNPLLEIVINSYQDRGFVEGQEYEFSMLPLGQEFTTLWRVPIDSDCGSMVEVSENGVDWVTAKLRSINQDGYSVWMKHGREAKSKLCRVRN